MLKGALAPTIFVTKQGESKLRPKFTNIVGADAPKNSTITKRNLLSIALEVWLIINQAKNHPRNGNLKFKT